MAGATVYLTLEGINFLASGSNRAGLEVPVGATLEITSASTGSLKATSSSSSGYSSGAGIGGGDDGGDDYGDDYGATITISGGTVTATSSASGTNYGAGIGSGRDGSNKVAVYITGGNVKVKGDETLQPVAKNGKETPVYCTAFTLQNAAGENILTTQLIRAGIITPSSSYGLKDVKTIQDGTEQKLFFWLPKTTNSGAVAVAATDSATNASAIYGNTNVTINNNNDNAYPLTINGAQIYSAGTFTVYRDNAEWKDYSRPFTLRRENGNSGRALGR